MIRRLRMKFIGICLGSLMLVIALLMGLLNFLNYREMVGGMDNLLDLLAENDGRFSPPERGSGFKELPDSFDGQNMFSPETPYATRFFSATLDENGEILTVDVEMISAVDSEEAKEYAAEAWRTEKQRGFLGDYRYRRIASEDDSLIVFLDCTREMGSVKNVLLTSAGVSMAGLFLVFVLIYIFSEL